MEVENVSDINGIPDVRRNRGDWILLDPQTIPVDMASDLQLYLLCIIGNQDSILPAFYDHHHIWSRKINRKGKKRKNQKKKSSGGMLVAELRNAGSA